MSKPAAKATSRRTGEFIAPVGQRYALIRTGKAKTSKTPKSDTAVELLKRAGKALAKPGITRGHTVFRDSRTGVFAYSVYSKDPSKVVRRSADGSTKIGRVVGGKFRSS